MRDEARRQFRKHNNFALGRSFRLWLLHCWGKLGRSRASHDVMAYNKKFAACGN